MAFHPYIVAADFHVRAGRNRRDEAAYCGVYTTESRRRRLPNLPLVPRRGRSQAFLLYMEWRDKASLEAHIGTPHVRHAEDRLKQEKMLVEPSREWHFYGL